MEPFIFVVSSDESLTNWIYVISGNSANEITNTPCYDAANRTSVSKSDYDGIKVKAVSIKDCISGFTSSGTIYKLSAIVAAAKAKLSVILIFCICTLFISSCKSGQELTYRYSQKDIDANYAAMGTLVDVDANLQDLPPSADPANLYTTSLDPKVQVALYKGLARKVSTGDSLFNYLSQPLQAESNPVPFLTKKLSFKKRLNIAVRDLSPYDADRIAKLSITLTEPTGAIRFTGCDKIVTQYQTVDLADLTFKNNTSGELDAGATYGGTAGTSHSASKRNKNGDTVTNSRNFSGTTGVNVSGKLAFNNELDGTASLQKRYVTLSGNFKDNTLSLYQESTTGINLNGTIVSDISFEFAADNATTYLFYSFRHLFDKDNNLIIPAKIDVTRRALTVPNVAPDASYPLNLSYTAVYRQVTDKDKYIAEGYHHVKFLQGTVNKNNNTVIIRGRDILPKKWQIMDTANRTLLRIGIRNNAVDLNFTSYENASDFLRWLLRTANPALPVSSDGYRMKYGNVNLALADLTNLMVVVK